MANRSFVLSGPVYLLATGLTVSGCADLNDIQTQAEPVKSSEVQGVDQMDGPDPVDLRLRLWEQDVTPLVIDGVKELDDPEVKLGQLLFFDKVLSGNQDIACSTCHHPTFGTSDALPTSIGVGGAGLGPNRILGDGREIIPRNSPDLFNRGSDLWSTMFWDARVSVAAGYFDTPAGTALPNGLDSLLAAQAMFPVTSADEMRGHGEENDISPFTKDELDRVWSSLTDRVVAIDEYIELFEQAYPDTAIDEIGFEHIANAIAAFEVAAFTKVDTPFDRFLAGDDRAMDNLALKGAELFYGEAGCSSCHSGSLMTDQKAHCIASPQLGPGKSDDMDFGRFHETNDEADRFAFRTPPLRNVELTGPYLHSGVFDTLEDVVRHHISPESSLREYEGGHLYGPFSEQVLTDTKVHDEIVSFLGTEIMYCQDTQEEAVTAIVAFLKALTDDSARQMEHLVPDGVPSGLPLF